MLLKVLIIFMIVACRSFCFAQEPASGISKSSLRPEFKKANALYSESRYEATDEELTDVERRLKTSEDAEDLLGVLYYWQGIVANRLNDFPKAISGFDKAIKLGFDSPDINYELGQALYANETMKRARAQFAKSYKKKYKRGVSLYYIAYISKEIRDFKKAHKFFKMIEKLPAEEAAEVKQAAEMQVADMYYEKAVNHPDEFRVMENHVVPAYEKALKIDDKSNLAPIIREKITAIQRKYDLLYFQLRNGRPVLRPPYFLRASQEIGYDSNVIFSPNETIVSKSKQHSQFSRTDMFGRYTFYHHDYFSISPELRATNTYYFNRVPEIYRNDNRVYAGAIRTSYEHDLMGRPAATLFDFDYNEVKRDINQKKRLQFNSSSLSFMAGQRFSFWERGESVLRLRWRRFDSYNDISDSKTISLSFEQVVAFSLDTLLIYTSIDRARVENDNFDTNAFTVRGDLILSRFREYVTPIIGVGVTRVDPVNLRSFRGIETLVNPSARLIRNIGKNWRAILKYDNQKYDSKDQLLFSYKKETYGLELEYLF